MLSPVRAITVSPVRPRAAAMAVVSTDGRRSPVPGGSLWHAWSRNSAQQYGGRTVQFWAIPVCLSAVALHFVPPQIHPAQATGRHAAGSLPGVSRPKLHPINHLLSDFHASFHLDISYSATSLSPLTSSSTTGGSRHHPHNLSTSSESWDNLRPVQSL